MALSVTPGTLYADWLARRERLREYHGERGPIVAIQLRVLDYLIERYRDNAEALRPAPPPLDVVYVNQRAIVINHHRSRGLVAGVKSKDEAINRVAAIVARMYDPDRGEEAGIDLNRAAVIDDPWFAWDEPDERTIKEYWFNTCFNLPMWLSRSPQSVRDAMLAMPYLPRAVVSQLSNRVARLDQVDEWAAEFLAICRNRLTVDCIAHAWRIRVAAGKKDRVTFRLREALVNWDLRAADTVRCLLGDESALVRSAAAELLAEVGELRDIGIISDLLAMSPSPDEEASERAALADSREKLANRLREPRSVLN